MDAASESPATTARRLIRRLDRAALATLQHDAEGWPCGSLVLVALDHAASPLLLLSELAEHTRNIARDPRLSLLFDDSADTANPLAEPRVTVFGRARRSDDPDLRNRFLRRHPSAREYADFKDFHLFQVAVARAHLVAGFGRIHWIEGPALLLDTADSAALEAAEPEIVEHMNRDHADAVALYARVLLGRSGEGWRMTGCDPEGIDLRRGAEIARLDFDSPVGDAEAARRQLVRLAKRARRSPGG
ncbi:MAG: HugZ family protein [Kiloniellales bacterium]